MTKNLKLIISATFSLLFVFTMNASCNSVILVKQNRKVEFVKKDPMKIKIIILNPKGREIPDHASKSINEIADYARNFFIKGMEKQGYSPKNKDIFELNNEGEVKIYIANSSLDMFELVDVKNKKKHAYEHIVGKKPAFENSVWWVFSNINDEVKYGFTGGGNATLGTSIANLPQKYQRITLDMDLGSSGYFTENKMKAVVHELGHALQLPHNGPIPASLGKDPNGNTLMGPIIRAFKKRYDANDSCVYLSKLSAAMLWKHPVFNNTYYESYENRDFEMTNIFIKLDSINNVVKVKGKINTSLPYHSLVLIDVPKKERKERKSPDNKKKLIQHGQKKNLNTNKKGSKLGKKNRPNATDRINPGYQDRGYVATLDKNGNFEFIVNKLTGPKGSFIVVACFNNGLITSKINSKDEVKKNWKVLKYNFLD